MAIIRYNKRIFYKNIIGLIVLYITLFAINSHSDQKFIGNTDQKNDIQQYSEIERTNRELRENVNQSSQEVLSVARTTLANVQLMVTILAIIIAAISGISLFAIMLYKNRIEKGETQLIDIKSEFEKIKNDTKDIKNEFNSSMESLSSMKNDVAALIEAKKTLEDGYHEISLHAQAIFTALQVKDPSPHIRLEHLQRLSQMSHPVGILPMIDILNNENEQENIRAEAAFGLGRYSDSNDVEKYWGQILDAFKRVMTSKSTPDKVIIESVQGVAKFKKNARALLELIVEWSRSDNPRIRKACTMAFEFASTYDHSVVQRLDELISFDSDDEVKKIAKRALEGINKIRETSSSG